MHRSLLPRSEFSRNVMTIMSGTVISQTIPVLLSPVLSRLYSPEEFGVFSMFTSIAAVMSVIATLRYEMAIMLPDKEEKAINVLQLSFMITLCLSVFVFLLALIFYAPLLHWSITSEIAPLLCFLPLFLLFAGGTQALNYWTSRQKKFQLLAIGKVGQTGSTGLVNVLLGFLHFSVAGLVIGAVSGQFASLLIYIFASIKKIRSLLPNVSISGMKENFRKYRTFLLVSTPHALLGVVQDMIVIFLISYFFSKTVLGYYSLGFRILKLPTAIISASAYQVFFQQATQLKHDADGLQRLIRNIYRQLSFIGLPIFVLIAIVAPQLFAFVFGNQWTEAGRIAQILSPWLFLNFIIAPIAAVTIVLNKQTWAIWLTVVDTVLRCSAIIIGGVFKNSHLAFLLLTIGSGSLLAYALYWFYHLPKRVKQIEYGVKE